MPKPLDPVVQEASKDVRPCDAETRVQMKAWIDNWKRMGPILERERIESLQRLDDTEAARIARDLVWPMGTLGDYRGGDDAAGLVAMKDALGKLENGRVIEPPLLGAARELLDYLVTLGRPGCLIGGLVVARWGEPRATQDVDATVLADFGEELTVLQALLRKFPSRDPRPTQRAELGRLALLTASNGVKIDLSFAAFPFEIEVLDRSSLWQITPELTMRTCSAEDLIIYKLVAARPQDLVDVTGVVQRQAARLDVERVRTWGRIFAEIKEDPELLRPFENDLRRLHL